MSALLTLAVVLFVRPAAFSASDDSRITVLVDGEMRYQFPAGQERSLTVAGKDGLRCLLEIKGGKARIVEADCPDQICRKMGWIGPGGSIICLPARVAVSCDSLSSAALDGVTR